MKMIINGERVDASDGKIIEVYNPATGEQIDTIPSATAEDVERALDAAQAGKEIWANTPLYERCNILKRFADLIVEHKEELAWINSRDTGKSIKDGRAEMGRIDIMIRGYAERANHLYSDCLPDAQPGMCASTSSSLLYYDSMPKGSIAWVSQSGAMCSSIYGRAMDAAINVPVVITTGNECDLEASDFVWHLVDDDRISVICVYCEGIKDREKFKAACAKAKKAKKPVLVFKNGKTARGGYACGAHTASDAGNMKALDYLAENGGKYALVTMCVGGGQGAAGIFEYLR